MSSMVGTAPTATNDVNEIITRDGMLRISSLRDLGLGQPPGRGRARALAIDDPHDRDRREEVSWRVPAGTRVGIVTPNEKCLLLCLLLRRMTNIFRSSMRYDTS